MIVKEPLGFGEEEEEFLSEPEREDFPEMPKLPKDILPF